MEGHPKAAGWVEGETAEETKQKQEIDMKSSLEYLQEIFD